MMQSPSMKACQTGPPDGGYGWMVVTSTFFIMGLTVAVQKNFGLFFLGIQNHFGVLTSTTSWVTSTTLAILHLGAPVASALSIQCTHRAVIVVGGLLTASGMILASLDLSLPWMYLSMGVLQGVGIAFCWIPANIMVSQYFQKLLPIAYAIAITGECVFAMIFSPLFQWLIEAYTWQGALLIIGGLQLNLCVCGALMRPLESPFQSQTLCTDNLDSTAAVPTPKKKPSFQWSLLRKPELLLYILFGIFAAAGFFIPSIFLVPYAHSQGIPPYRAASILSVLAFADLGGRLVCGWLANMRLVRTLRLLMMVVVMLGLVLLLLPLGQNYWAILVFSSLYGFLFGCVVSIHITSIVDILGMEDFDSSLGLYIFFRSIGSCIAPPAAGWLVDWTHDYSAAFYLSGSCFILSGVFVVLVDRLIQRGEAAPNETSDLSSGMESSADKKGEKQGE